MLAILNSGWFLALVIIAFGFFFGLKAVQAIRRGKLLSAVASILMGGGYLCIAGLGFLGSAIERGAHSIQYARALRLLALMRVCGVTGACLILIGTALTIYCGSQTREAKRRDNEQDLCSIPTPAEAWPPPPKHPKT